MPVTKLLSKPLDTTVLDTEWRALALKKQERDALVRQIAEMERGRRLNTLAFDLATRVHVLFPDSYTVTEKDVVMDVQRWKKDGIRFSAQYTETHDAPQDSSARGKKIPITEEFTMHIRKDPLTIEDATYSPGLYSLDFPAIYGDRLKRQMEFLQILIQKVREAGQNLVPDAQPSPFLQERLTRRPSGV